MICCFSVRFHLLLILLLKGTGTTLAETFDEVLAECLANNQNRILCHGYNGKRNVGGVSFYTNCPKLNSADCYILLRCKVLTGFESSFDQPIRVTVAMKFGNVAIGKQLYLEFGFWKTKPGIPRAVGIHGARTVDGQLKAFLVQQMDANVNVNEFFPQTAGRLGVELYGTETSLVLSYALPLHNISIDGTYRHPYSDFNRAYIVAGYEGKPRDKVQLPSIQKDEIFNHKGYQYAACGGDTKTRCLTLTETCTEDCIRTSSCLVLVRITYTRSNTVTLYVNRQLNDLSPAYVSAGFSPDTGMNNTLVFDCIKDPSGATLSDLSYNDGHQNIGSSLSGLPSSHRFGRPNFLECFWTLTYDRVYRTYELRVHLSKNAYHILLAIGSVSDTNAPLVGASYKNKHILKSATGTPLKISSSGITDAPGVTAGACVPTTLIPIGTTASTTSTTALIPIGTTASTASTATTGTTTITTITTATRPGTDKTMPLPITQPSVYTMSTASIGETTNVVSVTKSTEERTRISIKTDSGPTTPEIPYNSTTVKDDSRKRFPWILALIVLVVLFVSSIFVVWWLFRRGKGKVNQRKDASKNSREIIGAHSINNPLSTATISSSTSANSERSRATELWQMGGPSRKISSIYRNARLHSSQTSGTSGPSQFSESSSRGTPHGSALPPSRGLSGTSGPSQFSVSSSGGTSHGSALPQSRGLSGTSGPSQFSVPSSGGTSHRSALPQSRGLSGTSGPSQFSVPSSSGTSHGSAPPQWSGFSGTSGPSQISVPSSGSTSHRSAPPQWSGSSDTSGPSRISAPSTGSTSHRSAPPQWSGFSDTSGPSRISAPSTGSTSHGSALPQGNAFSGTGSPSQFSRPSDESSQSHRSPPSDRRSETSGPSQVSATSDRSGSSHSSGPTRPHARHRSDHTQRGS